MRNKQDDDEFIRLRPFIQPVYTNGELDKAITLTTAGRMEVVDLKKAHSFQDTNYLNKLSAEGKFWHIPNFEEQVTIYQSQYNRIASAHHEGDDLPTETFMKDALSEVFRELMKFLQYYLALDKPAYYALLAIFAIHSYFKRQMPMCPLLLIEGSYSSGKSACIAIMSKVCYRPHTDGNYSPASLVDKIDKFDCTLLLDEAKDNFFSERGADLNNFLKNATSVDGKYTRMRKNSDGTMYSVSVPLFSDILVCTLGGFKEDTKSRGISIKTPEFNLSDCPDYDLINCVGEVSGYNDPAEIQKKLYALKFLTESYQFDKGVDVGWNATVSFKNSLKEAYYDLKTGAYAERENMLECKPVRNRSLKVLCGYYAISRYTGASKEILEQLLKGEASKSEDKKYTRYGAVVFAMCERILAINWNGPGEYQKYPISLDNLQKTAKGTKLKEITEQAEFGLRNSDAYPENVVVERDTVNEVLNKLNIPVRDGASRYKYLYPQDPTFLENFGIAVYKYAPELRSMFPECIFKTIEKAVKEDEKVNVVNPTAELDRGYC